MTLNEFLKKLAKTPRGWYGAGGWLRAFAGCYVCPITSVYVASSEGQYLGVGEWAEAAAALGLRHHTAERIQEAADKQGEPKLRARLLKACGLPSKP